MQNSPMFVKITTGKMRKTKNHQLCQFCIKVYTTGIMQSPKLQVSVSKISKMSMVTLTLHLRVFRNKQKKAKPCVIFVLNILYICTWWHGLLL